MKILIVNFQDRCHPYAGGAEVHLHEVFGRLARRGHDVTLLSSGWRGARRRESVDGMAIHRVGSRPTFPFLARRYVQSHLRGPWDVVVEDLNKVPLCVHRWSTAPMVLLTHHLFGRTAFSAAPWPIAIGVYGAECLLGRLYQGMPVVAVSESTAAELVDRGIDDDRIWVIPNGADDSDDSASIPSSGSSALVYVGRLQPYKRVDVLLRALARLRDQNVDARLEIAGVGPMRGRLERQSAALGLGDRVRFHGRVSEAEKAALFRQAALHVTASEKEGWGLSVMEAGRYGVPTIATYVPGLQDSVIHERTGVLVPRNDPTAFADAIALLLSDGQRRAEYGSTARLFAGLHSWDATVDATEELLSNAARGVTRHRRRVRLIQRSPFQHSTLPRLGQGAVPYGAEAIQVELCYRGRTYDVHVVIGASDAAGRYPAIELHRPPAWLASRLDARGGVIPLGHSGSVVWPLLAWPSPQLDWIEDALGGLLGVTHVRARRAMATSDSEQRRAFR